MWTHTSNTHTPHVHVKNSTWYCLSDRITVALCITITLSLLLSSLLPLLVLLLIATEFDFVLFQFYSVTILFYLRLVCVSGPGIGQVFSHRTNIPSLILVLWDCLLSSPDWPWIWVLLDDRHSWDDRHILLMPGTKPEFERNSSEPYVSSIQNTVSLPPDFTSLSHSILILTYAGDQIQV